ncbi:acyl carrier protein [Micromonospora sp. DT46]|jgi:acyl carrier protein|uniref:acyl carrier protein n=1 Tax=unclassified Micromonospora TaxID=2617518 RepID=UPI00124B70B4|nr:MULTISPECIES: acyl carrier protein [unclassified Micromonospora]KAB1162376.1 acyl carrier protein [Micromonospora sp. AMSO12t]WSG01446.1 acyl carrier protein [Micromonospora sp. NBC_01740]
MSETVNTQILSFIQGRFPQAQIGETDDIFACGYINSLFAMELVMFLEKTFEFTIPNDELSIDNFRTVSAMTALVDRQRRGVTVG